MKPPLTPFAAAALLASVVALGVPPQAHACSGHECLPDRFLPVEGGSLPANLPGLYWEAGSDQTPDLDASVEDPGRTRPEQLTFRCTGVGGSTRDVPFHVEQPAESWQSGTIVPDAALNAGEHCALGTSFEPCAVEDFNSGSKVGLTGRAEFDVIAPTPLPTEFGTLRADAASVRDLTLAHDASCYEQSVLCAVQIDAELAAATQPWAELLVFETIVDGKRWRASRAANLPNIQGGSFVGRGVDVVFERPNENDGFTPVTRTVVMRAALPGTAIVLESAPIEIALDCPFVPPPPLDTWAPDSGPGHGPGPWLQDAGPGPQATDVDDADDRDDSGCSLLGAPSTGAGAGAWWSTVLLFLPRLSRRRRAPASR
jgi:hypothetical protein